MSFGAVAGAVIGVAGAAYSANQQKKAAAGAAGASNQQAQLAFHRWEFRC